MRASLSICSVWVLFPAILQGLSAPAGISRAPLSPNQQALADAPPFPRTWVPLASVAELDPNRPTKVQFLGQTYVTYRDNHGQWVVVDDACPHRLAPLSEGRVNRDNNSLQCSYHGWEFDGSDGKCQSIPQMPLEDAQRARANPRCHVQSYSVVVEKDALFAWLWPEDPLSVATVKQASPEGIMEGVPRTGKTFTRDLPYGWDTLLENIADPSHVPFAHHGLQGTRDDAIPINMTLSQELGEWGFSCTLGDRTMKMMRQTNLYFQGPYVIRYKGQFLPKEEEAHQQKEKDNEPPRTFDLSAVMVPTAPGRSRIILFTGKGEDTDKDKHKHNNEKAVDTTKGRKKTSLFLRIFSLLPVWLSHTLSNRFLDTDLAFLHYQERERERRGQDVDAFFIPAKADRSIRAIRDWIRRYAHIPGPLPAAETSKTQLFDRFAQHAEHCVHCSKALADIATWRTRAHRVLAVSILLFKRFVAARVTAVLCLGVLQLLAMTERAMRVGGFDHAKNH